MLAGLLALATLPACETPDQVVDQAPVEERVVVRGPVVPDAPVTISNGPTRDGRVREIVVRGTGRFLNQGTAQTEVPRTITPTDGSITLNLSDVSIRSAADAILGEALQVPYTIADDVRGNVTVQTTSPLDASSTLRVFQTVLELNGATLSTVNETVVISRIEGTPARFAIGSGGTFGRSVVVVPLEFIAAAEMSRLLEPIASQGSVVDTDETRNLLFVSGNRAEIDAVLNAVNLFDVDVLAGKSVALFPLEFTQPEAIGEELTRIFDAGEGGALENVVSFLPNERLNSILVISSREVIPVASAHMDRASG